MFRQQIHHVSHRSHHVLQALLLMLPVFFGAVPSISAAQLDNRTLRVSTAQIGTASNHEFSFLVASPDPVGSISFTYCDNSPMFSDPCSSPVGLNLSAASLAAQTGNTGFTYSASASTVNVAVISRAQTPAAAVQSSYRINNIINPTTAAKTTFVRIATHSSIDGTGPAIDRGSVAFATQDVFRVDAYVPPFLTFCAGVFVTLNCNSVTGSYIDIGELGARRTATGLMQFSGATNDPGGYTTYLNGFTMTSGNNIIDPLAVNAPSQQGTAQFGLNLRANSSPSFGLEPVGPGSSTPTAGYGAANSYRFVNGEPVTTSSLPTDFKIFTAAFIVNVGPQQPPGVYVTTMTYTAIASF